MESTTLPPTDLDELPPEPPAWPKVVGIISICWGGLGLFCAACGLLSPFLVKNFTPAEVGELPPQYTPTPLMMGVTLFGMIMALVCITAGSLSVARNPVTKPMHIIYAVIAILLGMYSMYYQVQMQAGLHQWALDHPDSPIAQGINGPGQKAGQLFGMLFGAIIGFGYPLFLIIWFGLVKRKASLR